MISHRDSCATCGSAELVEIIDLGMHAMADTFVPEDRRYEGDRIYPLICDLCAACAQVQLRTITDPKERYSHFDYSYTSSNSQFSRNHWTRYAADVPTSLSLTKGSFVVEIGSNDGFLCGKLIEMGFATLGVDPSAAMCELAGQRGVDTHNALFTEALADQLVNTLPNRPQLIVANNVFNHANDPLEFAKGVAHLLAPGGTFVFELPYFLKTILDGKFDQIYHEHVSYCTVTHSRNLFRQAGMVVVHAEEVDYHGGSIRVFVRHRGDAEQSVDDLIAAEAKAQLFEEKTYLQFMRRVQTNRDSFMRRVYELKAAGARIVCVGAAAKANTFMSYYNLDASLVDWVTDASPSKIGKFTPRTRVRIASDTVLADYDDVYAIITSWNLAVTLRKTLTALNPKVKFLDPYETN